MTLEILRIYYYYTRKHKKSEKNYMMEMKKLHKENEDISNLKQFYINKALFLENISNIISIKSN